MFYNKKIKTEDTELFEGIGDYGLAKLSGTSQPYLNAVKNGKVIISEKQYLRLKKLKEEHLKNKNSQ